METWRETNFKPRLTKPLEENKEEGLMKNAKMF